MRQRFTQRAVSGKMEESRPRYIITQSYDPISCNENSAERTNEIAYRVFLPIHTTEYDTGSGP